MLSFFHVPGRTEQNMIDFGYRDKDEISQGVCHGMVMMGIGAFLSKDIRSFIERNKDYDDVLRLNTKHKNLYDYLSKSESSTYKSFTQNEINLMAFFDGIALYQNPESYKRYFSNPVSIGNNNVINPMTSSSNIDKHGGRIEINGWVGIYDYKKLLQYFHNLSEVLNKYNQDVAFSFHNEDHTIGLCYNAELHNWILINHAPSIKVRQFSQIDNEDFINYLLDIFDLKKNSHLGIETKIHTLKIDETKVKNILADLSINKEFIDIHKITPDIVNLKTTSGFSLAYYAAKGGYVDTIKSLIEYKANLHEEMPNKFTPIMIAARREQLDIIKECITNQIDLECTAHIAAYYGYLEIIQLLSDASLTKYYKNWNPAQYAASRGNLEILKALDDRNISLTEDGPDGKKVLDIAREYNKKKVINFLLNCSRRENIIGYQSKL